MLAISRKADYALVAVAELACADGVRLTSTRLADATDAPEALLRNILKDLARAGLIRGERGPLGGYTLNAPTADISVLDIIEAIDGPIALARCCAPGESPEEHGCTHSPRCRIQNAMRLMHSGVLEILRNVTVDDLADRENRATPPTVPIRIDGSNEHTPDAQRTGSRTLTHDLTPDHGGR